MNMVSKDTEYSMLKQEIISESEIISNVTIAMYTITLSIFVLGAEFDNSIIFLAPYIILFPFQNIINRKRDGINRIAAYMAVFLEDEKGWEGRYNEIFEAMRGYDKNLMLARRIWNFIIGRTNSTQLGLLSTLIFNLFYWKNLNFNSMGFEDATIVIISVVLFIILALVNKTSISNVGRRNMYIEQLKLINKKK